MPENNELLLLFFQEVLPFASKLKKELAEYLKLKIKIKVMSKLPPGKRRGQQKLASDFLPIILTLSQSAGCQLGLGIIADDLYVPTLNFVFGLASPRIKTAIVSYYRLLSTNDEVTFKRLLTECVHELGHLFNLPHCQNPHCVMFFSNTLNDTDRKGYLFCQNCFQKFTRYRFL
ncbi:MAG: peptidase zinc-dependent [Candidatus Heimdallarchaeota archaeon]|nr:peptidase zinc-dependent [Candidatus Heimdallarchaeota archaeon]